MQDSESNSVSGPVEACKTYIEQTKLLVALASAFVVAPAALIPLLSVTRSLPTTSSFVTPLLLSEAAFILSVLAGYFVLATIAGSQHRNLFDVYRPATRWFSILQIVVYVAGLVLFVWFLGVVLAAVRTTSTLCG